jgi:hypothetical protein
MPPLPATVANSSPPVAGVTNGIPAWRSQCPYLGVRDMTGT